MFLHLCFFKNESVKKFSTPYWFMSHFETIGFSGNDLSVPKPMLSELLCAFEPSEASACEDSFTRRKDSVQSK